METNDTTYSGFALTIDDICKVTNNPVGAATFRLNTSVKFFLNVEGDEKFYVTAKLQSVSVNKCMGKHNSIEARVQVEQLKESDSKVMDKITFSLTQLQDVFKNRKVKLTVEKENNYAFTAADNYFIYGVWPSFSKTKKQCYLDLGIFSWDVLLDNDRYSKCYTAKRLGEDILRKMAEVHGHKEDVMVNMNVLKHEYQEGDTKKKIELTLPFLVQYNETEYEFMLRNANRCGEFLFFESGNLNLGLTTYKGVDVSGYSSLESMYSSMAKSDSTCYHHNAINQGPTPGKHPYVGEYSNEDYYEPFNDKQYDSKKKWMELNPPMWSRAVSALFRYNNILSYALDFGLGEMATGNAAKKCADDSYDNFKKKYFDENGKKEKSSWKYAEDSANKDYRYAQFSEYYKDSKNRQANAGEIKMTERMDADAFFEMRMLEEECAKNQYVLKFDSCQKEIMLGSVLEIPDIKANGKYLVVEIESESEISDTKTKDEMAVTVIPYDESTFRGVKKTVPLPAEVEAIRKVGPQTAKVTDNMDPEHLDRVRVRFSWESQTDDTPWISVNTPWATSGGSGVAYKLNEGDEVVVDFEYGNVERPFVAGSRYNSKNIPPYGQRCFSTIIRSNNGHYIGFMDSTYGGTILTSLMPGLNFLKFLPIANNLLTIPTKNDNVKSVLGGIEISDANGMYKIATSSGQRAIEIQSPFGTVNMSAAMGITITAPNGNVKIIGKNVDIVAGNNLTLKSGTNIDNCLASAFKGGKGSFEKYGVSLLDTLASKVTGLVDIPGIRFAIELFLKPIAGTLKIHSGRYLMIEGGGASAPLPAGMRELADINDGAQTADGRDAKMQIYQLIKNVKRCIGNFKAYKQAYKDAYRNACAKRAALKQFMEKLPSLQQPDGIEEKINEWLAQNVDVTKENVEALFKQEYIKSLKARAMLRSTFDSNVKRIVDDINQIRVMKTQLSDDNWNPNIFASGDKQLGKMKHIFVIPRKEDFNKFNTADDGLENLLFLSIDVQNTLLRECVLEVMDIENQNSLFSAGDFQGDYDTDESWEQLVTAVIPRNKTKAVWAWFTKHGYEALNNVIPMDTLNSYSWDKESKGEILISSKSGSVYTVEGDTLRKRVSASIEDVKDAMRMATL